MIHVFIAALIAINAIFVLLEFALVRVRPASIEVLARRGNPRALAAQDVLGRLDEHLAAIQVGITVISLALGAVGEPKVTEELNSRFSAWVAGLPASWVRAASFFIAVSALAVVQIILAELVPRAVAIRSPEPVVLYGARPLKVLAAVLRLPIGLATACSRGILRFAGLQPTLETEHAVSVDEMRVLLGQSQEKGAIPLERLLLLENLFDFGSAKVSDAMRPRDKIAFLSLSRSWPENLAVIRQKRFTRYPLCEADDLEMVIGYVHLKDLVLRDEGPAPDLRKLRRDVFEVSEAEPLEKLLKTMPDKGAHMAVVRDGLNRVAGVLTLEDIVEEIIGEVRDEFEKPRAWAAGELFAGAVVDANLPSADRRDAIRRLLDRMRSGQSGFDAGAAFQAVWERELKFASAIGRGVIVPHARLAGLGEPAVAVGRYAKPAAFPTPDGVPVRLVFLVLTPAETPVAQLKILQRIAAIVGNENLRRKLCRAKTDEALLDILRTADTLLAS